MELLFWLNVIPFIMAGVLATPIAREWLPKIIQTWTTSLFMAGIFVALLSQFPDVEDNGYILQTAEWMPELGLSFSFYLDGLSLLFGLVVSGIGAAIFLYAGYYFEDQAEQSRFNMLLMAFTGAMLGLVLSGNVLTMFIMWELTSITSFLLIGFKGSKYESARQGASRALVITGGGGLALIAGSLLMAVAAGQINGTGFSTEWIDILNTPDLANHDWYIGFTVLLMLGAFTKSAQFPFHFWLPGAMDAPTPASAFLHSATMVKAGIYLLARLYPALGTTDFWSTSLLTIGLLTMTLGAVFSVRQRDLKGLLAYTTISKLGAIVALIGVPDSQGLKAAFVGIVAHALYKSVLFLMVGSIDHSTGTRDLDKLGGLWKYMPFTGVLVIISAVSMAGVPPLMGFVSKETLIAAMLNYAPSAELATGAVIISAIFTVVAAVILIWDVFFGESRSEIHFHASPPPINAGPTVIALVTLSLGFLLDPILIPLLEVAVPKEFDLYLFPGFNTEFMLSMFAIGAGLALAAVRKTLIAMPDLIPFNGFQIYNRFIAGLQAIADGVLTTQGGKLRYYLITILGVVFTIIIASGLLADVASSETLLPESDFISTTSDVLDLILLAVTIASAIGAIVFKRHLYAALSLGLMGYAIAGIFFVEQAPDVALVQFMIETLATVLVIIVLSRTNNIKAREASEKVFASNTGYGVYRDIAIATMAGIIVGTFALIAVANRPQPDDASDSTERTTIAEWHIENAGTQLEIPDIVAAILTDFRGMDTLIEIGVFGMAALGILALISLNRDKPKLDSLTDDGFVEEKHTVKRPSILNTPFTRLVVVIVLPVSLMISTVHLLYGAGAPGDGFTAGVVAGLGVSAWYIVFGYEKVKRYLWWYRPTRFLSAGLLLAVLNGMLPIIIDDGAFMGFVKLDFDPAGLKFATTTVFEIGIALSVFGAVGAMLEAIAHPGDVAELEDAGDYDADNEREDQLAALQAVPVEAPLGLEER